jgi:MSHA biogenesis protein MshP
MKRTIEPHSLKYVRGFSLVAAIFVLVILAALGAFMITIGEAARWTTVGAAQGARTYQAAEAGLEWGIFQAVTPPGSCVPNSTFSTTFTLNAGGLNGYSVGVDCTPTGVTEGGIPYNTYAIASKATFGTFGSPDYFSRTLQVTVTSAP